MKKLNLAAILLIVLSGFTLCLRFNPQEQLTVIFEDPVPSALEPSMELENGQISPELEAWGIQKLQERRKWILNLKK